MDFVAKFLEQNRDMAEIIHNKLEEQRCCLNPPNSRKRKLLASIYSITDENALVALMERAQEIQKQTEDENRQVLALRNKSLIANNANFKSKHEHDLLDTLCGVLILHNSYGETNGKFVLNTFECKFETTLIRGNGNNKGKIISCKIDKIQLNSIQMRKNTLNEIIAKFAFQSAMTCVEFATFLDKVIFALVKKCYEVCNDLYVPHYIPVVNIANLLLCAMNEQEQNDATLTCSTMSLVERVLYDEFLLKCITEK